MTNLNKHTKAELIKLVTDSNANSQHAINVANYFYGNIEAMDKEIIKLPAPGRIKFFWIINNWQLILNIITFIIERIKEVKDKVSEINSAATKPPAKTVPIDGPVD